MTFRKREARELRQRDAEARRVEPLPALPPAVGRPRAGREALPRAAVQQCVRKEYGGCVAKLAEVLAAEPAHPRANILLGAMYPGLLSLSERP